MGLSKFRKVKAEDELYLNLSCLFSVDILDQIEIEQIDDTEQEDKEEGPTNDL